MILNLKFTADVQKGYRATKEKMLLSNSVDESKAHSRAGANGERETSISISGGLSK